MRHHLPAVLLYVEDGEQKIHQEISPVENLGTNNVRGGIARTSVV
jgi:hypothetical protein